MLGDQIGQPFQPAGCDVSADAGVDELDPFAGEFILLPLLIGDAEVGVLILQIVKEYPIVFCFRRDGIAEEKNDIALLQVIAPSSFAGSAAFVSRHRVLR